MHNDTWSAVDQYLAARLMPADAALDAALAASVDAGLPAINVSPMQGRLLQILARAAGAARILEIGTLGGYSTIWLARALPADGRLMSLETDPAHAAVARRNIAAAGLDRVVEIRVGAALDLLPQSPPKAGRRSTSCLSTPTRSTRSRTCSGRSRCRGPGR